MLLVAFDRESAVQLLTALRLLEGRLAPAGQRLCPGVLELRDALTRSVVDSGGQLPAGARGGLDDGDVSPLLDIAEVRYRLNVSEKTVRRLVADGELVAIRVGSLLRFDPLEVTRFLTRARTDADKPEAAA